MRLVPNPDWERLHGSIVSGITAREAPCPTTDARCSNKSRYMVVEFPEKQVGLTRDEILYLGFDADLVARQSDPDEGGLVHMLLTRTQYHRIIIRRMIDVSLRLRRYFLDYDRRH